MGGQQPPTRHTAKPVIRVPHLRLTEIPPVVVVVVVHTLMPVLMVAP
jgi:hypothetical protein